ncbi:MAG: DUF3108 domain-containing protein [Gemmatimonadetes bacterium]|nr:DUF3108 domain-containing protein [Gemmatimonadota bacterium]NNF12441.1 DUF3108 domain-containing protein [Gemmatimonadota bacterium]NNL30387.1 DUF3108 domain-containing protein [Gemmatimonadota bacterium]
MSTRDEPRGFTPVRRPVRILAAVALAALFAAPFGVEGQNGTNGEPARDRDFIVDSLRTVFPPADVPVTLTADDVPEDRFAARAPFGPGEHLVYKVKVGIFGVGEGFMAVVGTDEHEGNPVYRVEMGIQGSLGPAKVDDLYQTWFDVSTLQTWRYVRDIDEIGYQSYRHWEFFPDRMRWERQDNDEAGDLGSALPLDEIAFIYYLRTLPLEVGKSYTLSRYFQEDGNPVTIKVLRKDQRETEGVHYNTIVISPEIQTDGLFGKGGKAEIHVTDDERRIPVYVKSDIPGFPGSLTLHLRSIQDGYPLHPQSRAEAMEGRALRADPTNQR